VLTRIATAFCRDGASKLYVQDRMQQHATDLWKAVSAERRYVRDVH
jgi:sulfite reductase alpha subunit-like flavoprotein